MLHRHLFLLATRIPMKPEPLLVTSGLLALVSGCAVFEVGRAPIKAEAHFTVAHIEISHVDVPPKPTKIVSPPVRIRSPEDGLDGYAIVQFIVDANGIPREVQWVEASDELFADLAATAITESRYSPARKGGKAVATKMEQRCTVRSVRANSVLPSDQPPGPPTIWIGDRMGPGNTATGKGPFDRGTYLPQS